MLTKVNVIFDTEVLMIETRVVHQQPLIKTNNNSYRSRVFLKSEITNMYPLKNVHIHPFLNYDYKKRIQSPLSQSTVILI